MRVVRSRVLYGILVWAEDLMASRRSLILLRRLHRTSAISIIREYRTVSYASASLLTASPPLQLLVLALQGVYEVRTRTPPPLGRRLKTFGGKLGERYGSGGAPTYTPKVRSRATGPLDRSSRTGKFERTAEGSRYPSA